MASFQSKPEGDTVAGKLRAFSSLNLLFCSLFAAILVAFFLLSAMRYERNGERQQVLNHFYQQLEDTHAALSSYASQESEALQEQIKRSLPLLSQDMEQLRQIRIDRTYQRDIEDLSCLLAHYQDFLLKALASDSQAYYQADTVYQAINASFRGLYSQILDESGRVLTDLKRRQRFFFAAVLASIILAIGGATRASRRLARAIVSPLEEFTGAIGDLAPPESEAFQEIALTSPSFAEMDVMVSVFNRMLRAMQDQLQTIRRQADVEIRLQQKELENLQMNNLLRASELKALQMQINPHFLFNTLNLISQTAYVEGADQTSGLLESTSALFRYTLDYAAREVTLGRELEILDIYVSLLEKRFAGRIRFLFQLDERFHDVKIPALILQPLVENAVHHGVGMYLEGGQVEICTRYDAKAKEGHITVADNGAGMDPQKAEEVDREMRREGAGQEKIGLANVYARLQAFYQGRARMEVRSEPGVRTEVEICLPAERREEHGNL